MRSLVRSVCPVASHSVGDLVHAGFEFRPHYAQAVAHAGPDLTVESPIRHRTDRLR
jgi:hypothetical protein